ncbi:MAG: ABC transporter ATP-binding protein [Bacteroidota bacterium]
MLKAEELGKIYHGQDVSTEALRGVNLEIDEGEFVAIMGPSGCGKSTLLNLFGLIDLPSYGELLFMDKPLSHMRPATRTMLRRQHIGFVFQYFNLIEELTVYENIELPLLYSRVPAKERRERVQTVMERLNVAHKSIFFPRQLSGGQQQRVAMCRAVVTNPKLILADEPTGNLDSTNGQEVMEFLTELNEQGTTVVAVTHSRTIAAYGQRILRLFDGQLVTGAVLSD